MSERVLRVAEEDVRALWDLANQIAELDARRAAEVARLTSACHAPPGYSLVLDNDPKIIGRWCIPDGRGDDGKPKFKFLPEQEAG